MNRILILSVFSFWSGLVHVNAQILPSERRVDWTLAGLRDNINSEFKVIDLQLYGLQGDGRSPNDEALEKVLTNLDNTRTILQFPDGNFLFNRTIFLPDHVVLKGSGANQTTLTLDMEGSGHGIRIEGSLSRSDTSSLSRAARKNSREIHVLQSAHFSQGDWLKVIQEDEDLVTSSWARHTVGQIVYIEKVDDNKITLASPLRMSYDLSRSPYIQKIFPAQDVGIECLKIDRIDDTSPQQSSNIRFRNAVNCWVKGIESQNCTFSHIYASNCSNIYVSNTYLHHAFNYGDGGRAYGIMLDFTTNECLIENNIFERLRHAMILQAGANGNVFAYNYSLDPYWTSFLNNAAGDMVLHGNYPYSNLFEQNICQNIVIDNSHGPNGPHNTFFRNRAESFGIFFSAPNSPHQNLIANEIPNRRFPYRIFNYTIQGSGHFLYGNNNKGRITPSETSILSDITYAYSSRPPFIQEQQLGGIGTPNLLSAASIPANDRYLSGNIFSTICENVITHLTSPSLSEAQTLIFPNPFHAAITIESKSQIKKVTIIDSKGQLVHSRKNIGFTCRIPTADWIPDIYYISIIFFNNQTLSKILLKS